MRYTCIETFCGAGGLGSGLKQAGFEMLWAFDLNPAAVKTYAENVSKNVEVADASVITADELLMKTGLKKGELTVLSGGPPCQGFSKQKRGGENGDDRNKLVIDYARLVRGLKPKVFIMENVDMFKKKRGKEYLDKLKLELGKSYDISVHEINCADYGVPQTRKRVIIVGIRNNLNLKFEFPQPTHSLRWVTVGEALRNIPEPPENGMDHPDYPNHSLAKISEKNKERIKYVPQGSGRKCLPRRLQLPCHKKSTGWPDVYGRLSFDKPASTITGGFDNFTRGRFAHPTAHRAITSREAAILQGFHPKYSFFGNKGEVRKQIGNAVPPVIGKVLGESIINSIVNMIEKQEKVETILSSEGGEVFGQIQDQSKGRRSVG
ncbi:DNA cytosine methyltransferase [Paenibacillus ihbetae]|uniref:DNA (cytosine-5-)-methyltransferase n=1 Tax=Paenibacillus ihbetae TaxID=1870820 RepID=A0ABX3JPF9_9BACL|nr:DNA cytosine methyltransferase [Paenibacillus ihbetae]OOC58736.1 hypothetical protein BBD40_23960 [Paenibacillus ihbetae]